MEERVVSGQVKTPFRRLNLGIMVGYSSVIVAVMIPAVLLLALKMNEVAPDNFTAAYGLVAGAGGIFAMIGSPIGGAISDRSNNGFGRRRTWIFLGPFIGSLALVWIGFATQVWEILIAWSLAQLIFNFGLTSFTALIPDQVDEAKQGTTSGLLGLSSPLGFIIGLLLLKLTDPFPGFYQWLTIAALGIIGPVISLFLIREGKLQMERTKTEKEKVPLGEKLSKLYPSPRKYPKFTWAIVYKFMFMMGTANVGYLSVMLIDRLGFNDSQASDSVTVISIITLIAGGVVGVLAGTWSDKVVKQKPFLYVSSFVVIIGLLIFAFIPNMTAFIIGGTIFGIATGCFNAIDKALIARILPRKEDAAKDFGIANIANTLPQSIVPAIAPFILGIGGWTFFYIFMCVCVFVGLFAIRPVPERQSSKNNTAGEAAQ